MYKRQFYMRHYHSNHFMWDNDMDKEFRTRIEGELSIAPVSYTHLFYVGTPSGRCRRNHNRMETGYGK